MCLFGEYNNEITRIWNDTSEDDFLPNVLAPRQPKNEDNPYYNNRTEVDEKERSAKIKQSISQSNDSYIEEFDNTDYLDVTATNASGWGNGSVRLYTEMLVPGTPPKYYSDTAGYAMSVFVQNNFAYVACGPDGLAIIDIRDPTSPGTPIYRNTADYARGVYIQDNYAYVADDNSGLAIINVSDPTNPGMPIYRDTSSSAQAVYIKDDYAFIANYNSGLAIINVSDPTNPGVPIYRDTIGIDSGGGAFDIHVQDNFAYLADGSGLAIINVSDPNNPGAPIYRNTSIIWDSDFAEGVYVSGTYAYIACESRGLAIIDISDPTQPGPPIYRGTTLTAINVHVYGFYAYVIHDSFGLAIIDISDSTHPGQPIFCSVASTNEDVFIQGDYAYIASGNNGLAIIRVKKRDPLSIVQSSSFFMGTGFVQNVTIKANQTDFPNTSIYHQISSDGNTWRPISLNETFNFVMNPYHGLYWRAVLEVENQRYPSPRIDSIRIDFDIYYDLEPPSISIISIQNHTTILPGTTIECSLKDFTLDQIWFSWDQNINLTLHEPWTITCPPLEEGYHWLFISANDSVGHHTTNQYLFYINHKPQIELKTPLNNSIIFPSSDIEFNISDPTLIYSWYQWDSREKILFSSPFIVKSLNLSGIHLLSVSTQDSWNSSTTLTFNFYILDPTTFKITHHPPTTTYSGETFFYPLTVVNNEDIALNLTLLVCGTMDDLLKGNNTQIVLNPGLNRTIELEIRPKHASTHELDIYLFFEDSVYYHEVLKFHVAPYWMSPTFLLPLLINSILLLIITMISGTSVIYARNQFIIRKLLREQHSKLTLLIDQLYISNLEAKVTKEEGKSDSQEISSRPLGFPQYLHLSESLDHEALIQQFYSLRDQIIEGDSNNLQKLSKLLTQAEELVKELIEVNNINDRS